MARATGMSDRMTPATTVDVNLIFTLRWKRARESAQSFLEPGRNTRSSWPRHPIPRRTQAGAAPTLQQDMHREEVLGLMLLSALAGAIIFAFIAVPPL
jgi:hypothetical protein